MGFFSLSQFCYSVASGWTFFLLLLLVRRDFPREVRGTQHIFTMYLVLLLNAMNFGNESRVPQTQCA